jgi:RNA polymerase sigma-70 factor, ECF subfamily
MIPDESMLMVDQPIQLDFDEYDRQDVQLVERAQERDPAAFSVLYERYRQQIVRFLRGMVRDMEVADELVQETFFIAWKKLSDVREPANFRAWLFRIAHNLATDYHRREPKSPPLSSQVLIEDEASFPALVVQGFEEHVQETELIKKALAQVSPTYRTCLDLYIFGNIRQSEIATMLDMSIRSVQRYIYHGMKQLREAYQRMEEDLDPESETETENRQFLQDIATRVDELPEPYRAVLRLHYLEKLSYHELAAKLALPIGTVKSHVSRGKKMLSLRYQRIQE